MANKPIPFSDQLRQAVDSSGVTRYRIYRDTGIDQTLLGKFVRGERDLSLSTIDKLAEYLGLEVVARGRPPAKKGK